MTRTALILTGASSDVTELSRYLDIQPSIIRTTFPEKSVADPFWYTEIASKASSVNDTLQMLIDRVSDRMDKILKVCHDGKVEPTVQILITCDYENRPEISLSPNSIEFVSKLGAELCIDVSYND